MKQLFIMAFRDLGRNRRRSFFSALALAIGLALLLLMAAVIQGEMRSSLDTSIRLQSGHVQVRAVSYDENKTSLAYEDLIENPQQMADQISSLPVVLAATPRLYASGIVAEQDHSVGVRVVGIEPSSSANQPYLDALTSGEFITAEDREGLMIGQSLADKLNVTVGDSVRLMVNTSNGDVDEQPFIVRGIFNTHIPGFDQATVFLPLAKAQAIAKAEGHASLIYVLLNDRDQSQPVVDALKTDRYNVLTWAQMNEMLSTTMQMADSYMILIYLIVLAITAAVIVNTLVMSVFERTREIGILSALGMRSGRIMAMFFIESALLAVGGIVLGLVIGLIITGLATKYGFYIGDMGISGILMGERIYAYLTMDDAVNLSVMAFIVTLLAALYPALLAARMEPVDALRGGKQA